MRRTTFQGVSYSGPSPSCVKLIKRGRCYVMKLELLTYLAVDPNESRLTVTNISVNLILTRATVYARATGAFVDICRNKMHLF